MLRHHSRWVMAGALVVLAACRRVPEPMSKDVVVYVARQVRTLDPARPLARAVAVSASTGKVLRVGTRDEALAAGDVFEVVELPDAVIVPGLADGHAHLASLGRMLSVVSLKGARSEDEVLERVRQATPESYQGEWLVGRGWDQTLWPGGEFPHRQRLDALFPRTPVFLTRVDGHAGWVNGEALRRSGIGKGTPDPLGGRILRDASGEPTGVLVDNALDLVKVSSPTDEQLERRLKRALERCASVGLTSVHDAGMDLRTFTLLQQWDLRGVLPLRVYAMADGQGPDADEFLGRGPYKGRMLEMRAVKFLADGALGSRGAALEAPYADEPKQQGLMLLEPAELTRRARQFADRGFQVAVHAIGDRANRVVLDTLLELERNRAGGRHRVEHVQVLRPEDVRRWKGSGLVASVQPTHATSDMRWAEQRLGPDRIQGAYLWRTLLDQGVPLALGSDFPVEDPNPLLGLYAARTRQDERGEPKQGWRADERLSGEQALAGFTRGPAYAAFAERERGVLTVGMAADFTVLPVDPVDGEPAALLSARVLRTVVAGQQTYRAPDREPAAR